MTTVNPYFCFNGNCEEVFNFYKSVFGGEFDRVARFGDMPMPGQEMSEEFKKRIMHVSLPIGKGTILMGSDSNPMMGDVTFGKNISISAQVESKEEADKIFNGLSAGGKITMPLGDAPWDAYFGMFDDKFGINWLVNYDYPQK
jgi:PhnB protein